MAGIQVTAAANLVTSEAGEAVAFDIVLTSQPLGPVTLALSVDQANELALSGTKFVFTPDNWNLPQTVFVYGRTDGVDDGDKLVQARFAAAVSTDLQYAGLQPTAVSVTNIDQDTAAGGLEVRELVDAAGVLFFVARQAQTGWGLWKTTGISAGAALDCDRWDSAWSASSRLSARGCTSLPGQRSLVKKCGKVTGRSQRR